MYQMQGRVRYSESDAEGRMTIAALINYLQDACTFQVEDLGVGLSYLRPQGLGWFITNWQLEMGQMPAFGDMITVSTWVYHLRGMFAYRNFTVENDKGETLVRANSIWLLMDIIKGYPVRVPQEMAEKYRMEPPLEKDWGQRKLAPASSYEDCFTVTVERGHIDTNRHMNNEHYIEIARETLPEDVRVTGIFTEYKKPAKLGDTLLVRCGIKENDIRQVLLTDGAGGIFAVVDFQVAYDS